MSSFDRRLAQTLKRNNALEEARLHELAERLLESDPLHPDEARG